MKRFALFVVLCILAAGAAAVGVEAWRWRERKLKDDERTREQTAAEDEAAGRLGLKTPPLPRHPLARHLALDDALRLEPDRRFLLAARELSGAAIGTGFSDGKWILFVGERELARVAELPDFVELMKALAPLARDWVAAAKVTGKASRVHAVRGHKEAFTAIREAQARWAGGDHAAAALHDSASAAAALTLQLPRTYDADDRLDAHAIALCAADMAAGADVRAEQAVLALALGYAGAAHDLAPPDEEPALHAFVTLNRRKLAEAARRKDANAGDRQLLLRWLMQDANEQALLGFIRATRDNEHLSVPTIGHLLLDEDQQIVAAASDALPALALAELESVRATAAPDVELVRMLVTARNSALQTLGNNEDLRARLATDLREADTKYEGPLWRGADTSAWYAAATAAALLGSARSGYALRPDATALADELATWPVPVAAHLSRWLKATIAADAGSTSEASDALATSKLPGARAAADLLVASGKQSDPPDPRFIELARVARRHFDSRPLSRLAWAEALRIHEQDPDRSERLTASVVDQAPGGYPFAEAGRAKRGGQIDRLEQLALDERTPFPARLEAAGALADRGPKAKAERALRRLSRERPADDATHERLIKFLHDSGRPADALAVAVDLVRTHGNDDSFRIARPRCAAARQLDAMGRHGDALAMVERALPTEAVCAYRIATVQLAHLGRKEDAENLMLAFLGRHPRPETAVTIAEVRWRARDNAAAADILAHPPGAFTRRDLLEIGVRFAEVFRSRPAAEVKPALDALLQAGIQTSAMLELGPPLLKAGATSHAFELYALLSPKLPAANRAGIQLTTWSALRAAKGAKVAEAWLRKQPEASALTDDALAIFAYGEGVDEALWDLFPTRTEDLATTERLTLLRAASIVRRGERGPRRDALLNELADPLARWKAWLARRLRLPGAYASWEVRLARYLMGTGVEDEIADEATDGSRPCEAPYYFGVRAAAESRARDAAAWHRVALECRNPGQPEFVWAHRAASQSGQSPTEQASPGPSRLAGR